MNKNDPYKHAIPAWCWGSRWEIYTNRAKAPRWVRNRGALRDPCGVAGCKCFIAKGAWYVRHPFLGPVCEPCAAGFGVVPPAGAQVQQLPRQ